MTGYNRRIDIKAYTTSDDTIFDVRERIAEALSTLDDVFVESIEVEDVYDPAHARFVVDMLRKTANL